MYSRGLRREYIKLHSLREYVKLHKVYTNKVMGNYLTAASHLSLLLGHTQYGLGAKLLVP